MILQPNKFRTCHDCSCETNCIPPYMAKLSDYFSYEITDINGFLSDNIIVNGKFVSNLNNWNQSVGSGVDWSWDAAQVCLVTVGQANPNSEYIDQIVGAQTYGILYFKHSSLAANITLKVYADSTEIGSYSGVLAEQTEQIAINQSFSNVKFRVLYTGSEEITEVWIDDVELYIFDISSFKVANCCLEPDDQNYVVSALDTDDVTVYDDYAEIKFRWSKYGSIGDSLKVCFDKEMILNGTFAVDLSDWTQTYQEGETVGDAWTYDAGSAETDMTANGLSKVLKQLIEFEKGCEYEITLTATGSAAEINLTLQSDDLSLNDVIVLDDATPTNVVVHFTPEYTGSQYISIFAELVLSAGGTTLNIDDVSIISTFCSQCYELNEYDCSLLIEATNTNGGFGLSSDFYGNMRIEGLLYKVKTDYKENIYRNTAGTYKNIFTDIALVYELQTYLLYTDQLMALMALLSFDNVQINKQYYVKKEGAIEIEWDDRHEFGKFSCELFLREQQQQKDYE